MATKRMISREKRLVRKSSNPLVIEARNALKDLIKNPEASPADRMAAQFKLQRRPLNESKVRTVRRCQACGRPKGVYRYFGLCRICLRQYFSKGMLPGLVKSSW